MGFSYAPAAATTQVRTGVERATLARRTYGLVFLSVLVTMGGVAFAGTQPALMQAVWRASVPVVPRRARAAASWRR